MSSRLLTMKFMQRAAASTSPTTPQTPEGPPSKRRKTSSNPQSLVPTPTSDAEVYQAAADFEDAKRAAAIERIAAEAGETKWVLSTASNGAHGEGGERKLRFMSAGYSEIDRDSRTSSMGEGGRRSFGRFNKEIEKPQVSEDGSDSEDSNGRTNSEHDEPDGGAGATPHQPPQQPQTQHTAKAGRKARRRARNRGAAKEVKLSKLTSISGGGSGASGIECHFCGQKGHKIAECPRKAKMKRGQKAKKQLVSELEY
ncbi:MAG: hypothetical protein LQ350_005795 [Teloschistes chrysophthalmus]|nr:MAG: hypothetical protein LQ350_005795 [Niorma chrysophthalma]